MRHGRTKSRGRGYAGRQSGAGRKALLVVLLLSCGLLTASGIYYYHSPEDAKAVVGKAAVVGERIKGDLPGTEAPADPFTVGRVTNVISLNEVEMEFGGRRHRISLLNISKGGGQTADAFTGKMRSKLLNTQVRLEPNVQEGFDAAGRRMGYLIVEGENYNLELVKEGFSAYDTTNGRSASYDMQFRMAEADARARKVGIWTAK